MRELSHHRLAELLNQARTGDQKAFDELYRATAPIQYRKALGMLARPDLAEEAVQESYLTLVKKWGQLHSPQALVAYLNRATHLNCLAILRRQTRQPELREDESLAAIPDIDELVQPEEAAQGRDEQLRLLRALSALPPDQREAVLLRYCQKLPLTQVAQTMDCSVSTVQRLLKRALSALRGQMGALPGIFTGPAVARALRRLPSSATAPSNAPPKGLSPGRAAAVLLAVAGMGLGLGAGTAPQIEWIRGESGWRNTPYPVEVAAAGPVSSAVFTGQDGATHPAQRQSNGHFFARLPQNGSYTLTLRSPVGRVVTAQFEVEDLDVTAPLLGKVFRQGGQTALPLTDEGSGVDWAAVRLVGADKTEYRPAGREENILLYALPNGTYTLEARDLAGNATRVQVSVFD